MPSMQLPQQLVALLQACLPTEPLVSEEDGLLASWTWLIGAAYLQFALRVLIVLLFDIMAPPPRLS